MNDETRSGEKPLPTPGQLADELELTMQKFWATVAELAPEEIETAEIAPDWTPKAEVAHVAFWDDYQLRRMQAALAGTARDGFACPALDNDARAVADAQRPWPEVVAAAEDARARLVAFAQDLPPSALAQTYPEGTGEFSILAQLQHMAWHVRMHRRTLQRYLGSLARWGRPGLRNLMVTQHANLMDSIAGLREETLETAQVCGVWTIRDVLAHLASWHAYNTLLLEQWPDPDPATIQEWVWREDDTMDSINARLLSARTHLSMVDIADQLMTYQRRMLYTFDQSDEAALQSEGLTWGGPGEKSCFYYEIYRHVAEHAAQIWAYRGQEVQASSTA